MISPSGNKEHVGKNVFWDEEMSTTSAVKKSYADAVKNSLCVQAHVDSTKSHLLQSSSDTTAQQANSK